MTDNPAHGYRVKYLAVAVLAAFRAATVPAIRPARPPGKEPSLFRAGLIATAGTVATIITLGMSAASAAVTSNGTTTVPGIQVTSVGCAATTCVAVGTDTSGSDAKTALVDPATGSVMLGSGVLKNTIYGSGPSFVACPDKTTCLGIPGFAEVADINTKTGAQKVTAKVTSNYSLSGIGCAGSKVCYAIGSYSPPSVQAATQGFLVTLSPAGKILSRSVNKAYVGYSGISCESSTFCLTSRWLLKGSIWQVASLVNGKFGKSHALPASFLPEVISCYSTKLCYVSGTNGDAGAIEEVIPLNPETGAPGKLIKLSKLAGGQPGAGFACYSSTQCVAASSITVGTGANAYSEAAYIVITKGRVGKPVVASTKVGSNFTSVSCASSQECYAVGTYPGPAGGNGPSVSIVDKV